MGDKLNRFYTAGSLDCWAELDEPGIFASLSEDERSAIFEGMNDMIVESKRVMLRHLPNLSHKGPNE